MLFSSGDGHPNATQVDLTEQLGSLACVGPGRGGVGSRDSTEN